MIQNHLSGNNRLIKKFCLLFSLYSLWEWVWNDERSFTSFVEAILSVSLGIYHACAVFDDGTMKCWGYSTGYGIYPPVDIGDTIDELGDNLPFFNPGSNVTITKASCGSYHSCIILNSNQLKCFGLQVSGQCGIGIKTSYVGKNSGHVGDALPVVNLGTDVEVFEVTTGYFHTCVVISDGKVKCFGRSNYGQLGNENSVQYGANSTMMGDNLPIVNLGTGYAVESVHSSSFALHNCALFTKPMSAAQKIKCWGSGGEYILGYGDTLNRGQRPGEMGDNLPFVDLGIESRVNQVKVGSEHTCALLINKSLKCWGWGAYGQLASGSKSSIAQTGDFLPSVTIDNGKIIKQLEIGGDSTCILYDDLVTVKCVGDNGGGQLGQGDTLVRGNSQTTTVDKIPAIDLGVGSNLSINAFHGGYFFNCVSFNDSSIKCFGFNENGQLAIGNYEYIGDEPNEMGHNLKFAFLLGPNNLTESPTMAPTIPPTTLTPTSAPSGTEQICLTTAFFMIFLSSLFHLF